MASSTAEYMALFRALESARPAESRLFEDPYAARFLRPALHRLVCLSRWRLGRTLIEGTLDRIWPGARASGVARTRLIDDALNAESSERKLEQVVFLGAGFDCRAHRQALSSAPIFVELDRPETQTSKRARLGEASNSDVRYAACDFATDDIESTLDHAGFSRRRRSFFIWEGVTNYLNPTAVDEVLALVSSSAPGSVLLFTYVDQLVLDEPHRFAGSSRLRSLLRSSDESWTFGLEPSEIREFLDHRGLRLLWDKGSVDYRAEYLGPQSPHLRGYEFYRAAAAVVVADREDGTGPGRNECLA